MSRTRLILIVIISSLLLFFIAIYLMPSPDLSGKIGTFNSVSDPATTLILITTVAVAIERVIELIWTVIGGTLGTYWPLNLIASQANGMVEDLNSSLKPFHKEVTSGLESLQAAGKITEEELSNAKEEINRLSNRFNEIKNLPLDNQRLQILIAVSLKNAEYISEKYGKIIGGVEQAQIIARAAVTGTQAFVETFKDNPGRRLISIYLGMLFGLSVTFFLNLNIFQAILGDIQGDERWQMLATGIVIGLGSGPTHEVIRAVQEYKKSKKGV